MDYFYDESLLKLDSHGHAGVIVKIAYVKIFKISPLCSMKKKKKKSFRFGMT